MGPKPTMEFEFVQDMSGSTLTMVSWSLINCEDSECSTTAEIIPVEYGFNCANHQRDVGVSYGIQHKYFQMEIAFSDGVTRKSNAFARRFFDARYRVAIQNNSLLVKELKGSNINEYLLLIIFGSMLYLPVALGGIFIIALGTGVYSTIKKEGSETFSKRMGNVFWWALVFTFIVFGLLVGASTFVATLAIELLTVFAILKHMKALTKKTLYGVFIANVFTQPLFAIASASVFFNGIISVSLFVCRIGVIVLEVVIWLVEVGIVNRAQDGQLPFKNILILIFILNAASFVIGLLLPI